MTENDSGASTPAAPRPAALLKIGALVGAPCAALVAFLALHKAGRIGPVDGLTYEATLIVNVALYGVLAFVALAAVSQRRWAAAVWRRQWPQVALLVFSLLLSAAFAEVAIRLLRPELAQRPFERLPSATLHHVNAPNRSSLGMGNQRVVTNADGFRSGYDRETFLEFPQRIVLLGDSYTFGLGVAADETVGSVLEAELRRELGGAAGEGVAVLNTGVISYSPFLERRMFAERAAAYRPTLTLVLVDANDFGDDYQYAQENVAPGGEPPRFDVPEVDDRGSLCDLSALCRASGPVWDRLSKPAWVIARILGRDEKAYDYYDFEIEIAGRSERNRFFVLRYPLEDSRPFLDATWGHLEALAQDVTAAGSDFAVVVMPRYFHWNDDECPNNWESDRYGVDEPHENAYLEFFDERAAAETRFSVWSLLAPFEQAEGPLVFDHDPHWNAAGHRVAGEALANWLVETGWPGRLRVEPRFSWPSSVGEAAAAPVGEPGPAAEPGSPPTDGPR